MKTKAMKIALIVETAILLLAALAGCLLLTGRSKELLRESSPDGRYTLSVTELGEPDWPFGADHLRVRLWASGRSDDFRVSFSADVANDGAEAAFDVQWQSDGVRVTLRGSEQPDAVYFLPFPTE